MNTRTHTLLTPSALNVTDPCLTSLRSPLLRDAMYTGPLTDGPGLEGKWPQFITTLSVKWAKGEPGSVAIQQVALHSEGYRTQDTGQRVYGYET